MMSVAPCDIHQGPAEGRLFSMYITAVVEMTRLKRRLKVCTDCRTKLVRDYGDQWSDAFVLTKFTQDSLCCNCNQPRDQIGTLHPVYVTAYGYSNQRWDYHASYCTACVRLLINHFGLENGSG